MFASHQPAATIIVLISSDLLVSLLTVVVTVYRRWRWCFEKKKMKMKRMFREGGLRYSNQLQTAHADAGRLSDVALTASGG